MLVKRNVITESKVFEEVKEAKKEMKDKKKNIQRELILDYIKRKWQFLLIVLILLLLNIWVWFIDEQKDKIKQVDDYQTISIFQ